MKIKGSRPLRLHVIKSETRVAASESEGSGIAGGGNAGAAGVIAVSGGKRRGVARKV